MIFSILYSGRWKSNFSWIHSIFEEENLINSFESNDKKRYFEIKKNQHSHFICTNCSKIECIHEKLNLTLPEYKIENIIIKGICKECLKKEKNEK